MAEKEKDRIVTEVSKLRRNLILGIRRASGRASQPAGGNGKRKRGGKSRRRQGGARRR